MRFPCATIIYVSAFSLLLASSVVHAADEGEQKARLMSYFKDKFQAAETMEDIKKDEAYWSRLMQETAMSLPPTPPPPPTPAAETPPPTTPPTLSPPTTPPTMAPTEECDIEIEIGCIPIELNETSCEQLPPLVTICEERPLWMQLKYYGGDCSQSANMMEEKFFCTDFAPIPQDAPVYVVATEFRDEEEIFFEGLLSINDLYNVSSDTGDRVPADMNLTVYDSQGGLILQRVQYHSSCSQNLFLKDRYGAHQLVGFYNTEQGLVDCFITTNYTFTMFNNGTAPAVLESLVALTTPFGPFDLTEQVLSQMVQPGDSFVVFLPIEIDLTVRQRYTVLATITGSFTDDTPTCSNSDFFDFIAGNALPPSIPTLAPTTAPADSDGIAPSAPTFLSPTAVSLTSSPAPA